MKSSITNQQIDRVVERDLPELGKFDNATLAAIKNILLMIAGSGEVSITGLVVCNSELAMEGNVVKVPLEYFLLM